MGCRACLPSVVLAETPTELSRPCALNLPGRIRAQRHSQPGRGLRQLGCLICHIATIFGREGGAAPEERYGLVSTRSQILGVAIVMRPANLGTTTCAAVFAMLLALIGPVAAQEASEETTGALPQETSTPPIEEGGAAVDQAAAGSGIFVTKRPVEVLAGPSSSASVLVWLSGWTALSIDWSRCGLCPNPGLEKQRNRLD